MFATNFCKPFTILSFLQMTALHYSVAYERVEHTKMLLHAKASPDCQDNDKKTVLHWAKTNKETMIISKLLVSNVAQFSNSLISFCVVSSRISLLFFRCCKGTRSSLDVKLIGLNDSCIWPPRNVSLN